MWSQVTLGIFRVSNKVCCKKINSILLSIVSTGVSIFIQCHDKYLNQQSEHSFVHLRCAILAMTISVHSSSFSACIHEMFDWHQWQVLFRYFHCQLFLLYLLHCCPQFFLFFFFRKGVITQFSKRKCSCSWKYMNCYTRTCSLEIHQR